MVRHFHYVARGERRVKAKRLHFLHDSFRKGHDMKKFMMWGLVAAMTVIGFASSPAQAKEPGVTPLEGKTAFEGPRGGSYRGHRGGRRGGYYRPRRGYYGGGFYYGGYYSRPRYYAPAPVIVTPPPTVYYGGTVSCY